MKKRGMIWQPEDLAVRKNKNRTEASVRLHNRAGASFDSNINE